MKTALFFLLFSLSPQAFCVQDKKQETLELAWQSFVYSKQLENAYALSKKASKLYPEEIIWLERLAQICVWTSRSQEAAEIYEKIYLKTRFSPSLFSNLGLLKDLKPKIYFELAEQKLQKNFSQKDFDDLLSLYLSYGENKKAKILAEKYLKNLTSPEIKEKLAFFYLSEGEIQKADSLFSQSSKKKSCEFLLEKAKLYFSQKKYQEAASLWERDYSCRQNKDFLFFFTDLFSLLGEYDTSAKIAEISMLNDFYREQDAEAVFNYYLKKDKDKAAQIALGAYRKFKKKYFLYFYLASAKNEKEKIEFLRKEAPQEKALLYSYEIKTQNKNGFNNWQAALANLKSSKDKDLSAQYIWSISQNGSLAFREAAGEQFNCLRESSPSLLLALAYLKASYGAHKDALVCFKKTLDQDSPQEESALQYFEFLRNSGFSSEAEFYERKAYNYILKQEKKEKLTPQELNLYLIFSNSAYFKEKLKNSGLSQEEKLELELSYLTQKDLKEEALKLIEENKQKAPNWANFYYIYEKKKDIEDIKNSGYAAPPLDLASLYMAEGKEKEAKNEINKALIYSPDNAQNHIFWKSLFLNKNEENGLYSSFEDKNFAQSFKNGARVLVLSSQNLKLAVEGETEKMNFFSGHGFAYREKNYSKLSLLAQGKTWETEVSKKKRLEDFYSFYAKKTLSFKKTELALSLNLNGESKETFSLENAGKADSFSQDISKRFSELWTAGFSNSFYNYKDQKGSFAGKANFQEFYIYWPKLGLSPYGKLASYNKTRLPLDSALNSLYSYENPSMLAKSFSEAGLNIYLFQDKGLPYSSRWETPLNLSISYNSRTFLNYSATLTFKTPGFKRKDSVFSFTYSQGASADNSSLFSCRFFLNFR